MSFSCLERMEESKKGEGNRVGGEARNPVGWRNGGGGAVRNFRRRPREMREKVQRGGRGETRVSVARWQEAE